jgi:hypothetical protein
MGYAGYAGQGISGPGEKTFLYRIIGRHEYLGDSVTEAMREARHLFAVTAGV